MIMNKNKLKIVKQLYVEPLIIKVKLDNEISLQLESNPPSFSNESAYTGNSNLNNDPFKSNIG
jgi:hypothetical protein